MRRGVSIVAVNLTGRIALANDDTICDITNLLDADGDETDNPDEAIAAVACYDDETWFSIRLDDFEKATH